MESGDTFFSKYGMCRICAAQYSHASQNISLERVVPSAKTQDAGKKCGPPGLLFDMASYGVGSSKRIFQQRPAFVRSDRMSKVRLLKWNLVLWTIGSLADVLWLS